MAGKDNKAKKVARFAANELLGIDDMRRVVKYVRQGDFKKAAKSAGAAAFEIGTSATALGKGGTLAAKAGSKMVSKKTVEKASTEIGYRAGRKTAETTRIGNVSREGKKFSKKVEGKAQVKGTSGSTSTTPDAKRISGTTPRPTTKEYAGRVEGEIKKRNKKIVTSADTARSASKPVIKKSLGDAAAKYTARGMVVQKGISEYNKKKK